MLGPELTQRIEKDVMLQVLDSHWKEHLASMDYLRQGIGLRGYAQRNPKQEYKREAFAMFESLLERIKHDVISMLMRLQVQSPDDVATLEAQARGSAKPASMEFKHDQPDSPPVRRGRCRGQAGRPGSGALPPGGAQAGPQRSLLVRLGQEVQALPRQTGVMIDGREPQ